MSASIDHLIPLSQGGGHVRANLRAAHRVCNVNRGIRGGNEQLMLIG
jgi:5-methylcytosine-specific restriction endonuclease McrA